MIVLTAGPQPLSVTFTPSIPADYNSASGSTTITVNKATPTIALTTTANTLLASNPVTFTATVSSSAGTPDGSVGFYDGTTLLGSGALALGVAPYPTSSLTVGTHSITATYSGDSNFLALTSAAVTETVDGFTIIIPSGGSSTATVSAGRNRQLFSNDCAFGEHDIPVGGDVCGHWPTIRRNGNLYAIDAR